MTTDAILLRLFGHGSQEVSIVPKGDEVGAIRRLETKGLLAVRRMAPGSLMADMGYWNIRPTDAGNAVLARAVDRYIARLNVGAVDAARAIREDVADEADVDRCIKLKLAVRSSGKVFLSALGRRAVNREDRH
jgi:hypothetical protein